MQDLLYLNDAAIQQCAISIDEVAESIRHAFVEKHALRAITGHPLYMKASPELDFKAKGGVLIAQGFAAMKWYGFAAGNAALNLPNFIPMILINRMPAGEPVAVMDGHWISGVRTAGLSAAAATVLADPDSRSVGFIAAGLQARSHLDALRARFPIERVTAYSLSGKGASTFVAYAQSLGLQAQVAECARDAVSNHQIVITSTPRLSSYTSFLDIDWLSPGTFVSMVDGGRAWDASGFDKLDMVVTDDLDPTDQKPLEELHYKGRFAGELSEVLAQSKFTAWCGNGRRALVFAGSGLADAAVSVLVYQRALELGLGQVLER
ncbi:MAG: ornithine cyclodeaminase family protein [Comamonadaceae bacterium]|nr:ornithine cyclodeaminase family protein [Comamonadaceae bacterium]